MLPTVGVGDFQNNFLVPTDSLGSATIDGTVNENYALQQNDILTVRSNGSKDLVGRCMLVPELDEITSYSGFVIRIRVDEIRLVPRFVCHFLKSRGTVYLLTRDGGGANINNINQSKLSALPLTFPTHKTSQAHVTDSIECLGEHVDTAKICYEQKLAALDELKQSILQKAFTGQLTSHSSELESVG